MSNIVEKSVGVLSLVQLSKTERELFLDYIHGTKGTTDYEFLYSILGDKLLQFLDVFAGETIKVMPREEVIKDIRYIKIYCYLESRGFTEESIESASRVFNRRKNSIVRIIEKVRRMKDRIKEDE